MFFVPCNNWKTLFLTQIYRYPEVWYNRHVAEFLETSVLKEVCILCPLSPNNTSMLLILNVQNKSSTSQIFSKIFVDSVSFIFFHFVNIHIFLQMKLLKLKSSLEACFLWRAAIKFLWRVSVFTNYFSQVRTKTSDAYYINNDFTSVIKV